MELRSSTRSGIKRDSLSPWTSPQKPSTPTKSQSKLIMGSLHRSARIAKTSRKPSPAQFRLGTLRRLQKLDYISDSDDEVHVFQRPEKYYECVVPDSED